jgi:hypothetical protein
MVFIIPVIIAFQKCNVGIIIIPINRTSAMMAFPKSSIMELKQAL